MQCTVEALDEYQCKPRRNCSRGPGRSEAEPTVRGPFRVVVAGAGACASTDQSTMPPSPAGRVSLWLLVPPTAQGSTCPLGILQQQRERR